MIANQVITVTTGATLLVAGRGHWDDKRNVRVVGAATNDVWLGGASVTTLSGIPLSSTTVAFEIDIHVNESLYAISTITNASVRVLATRAGNVTVV